MFGRIGASLGATLGFLQAYALPIRWNIGPEARYWERVRRLVSRLAGLVDERAGPRPVSGGEYAGRVDASLDALETGLWDAGFIRNPFSRLKIRDGEPEDGSWVYRDSPLARRQLHLMLFERHDGAVDVYAHEEPSSVHPLAGWHHFDGLDQDVAAGVARARDILSVDSSAATIDPLHGRWDEHPDIDG